MGLLSLADVIYLAIKVLRVEKFHVFNFSEKSRYLTTWIQRAATLEEETCVTSFLRDLGPCDTPVPHAHACYLIYGTCRVPIPEASVEYSTT